ncbi:MAG: 30S ribosomal protein S3ae [Candidatus Lokiarchaeota archaeon]|nr:30S ribosomal protein S3ae [Candidatus Lokiarchaeota archaeon]
MSRRKKRSRRSKKKVGLKKLYTLIAPKYFNEVELGFTPAKDPEQILGRTVEITLSDITNDFSVMHIKLKFKVTEVIGEKAHTEFISSNFTRDYLRSLVRRSTTRVDGIFNIKTSDDYKVRVTSLVFTESRVADRHKYSIRKIMRELIEQEAANLPFSKFVQDIIYGKIATKIYRKAKDLVPVRKAEILKTKVVKTPAAS